MKQYESYKDSHIPSIGNVPDGWKVVPIKYVLEQSSNGIKIGPFGSTLTGKVSPDNEVKVYGQWNVIGKDFSAGKNYVSEKTYQELESYWIHPNDILISMMGTVGKCAIIPKGVAKGIMDSHIVKVRLDESVILPQYFYYVYDKDGSNVVMSQIQRDRRGSIMDGLNSTLIKGFIIPLPSLPEQQVIASYLDTKVSQIDSIIAEKEAMVEDLQKYRKTIISETITCGLDPNVKKKYSGVEWIGMIPEHWECAMLKYYLDQPLQYGANESAESENKGWPRYIRITDISDTGRLKDETFKSLAPEKAKDYMLEKGDILFARSGATVGKTYIFKEDYPACFAGYLIKARCNHKLLPEFLYYYTCTKEYDNWKNSTFIQATIQNIGADKYSTMPIIVPSTIDEQTKIVEQIEKKLITVDASVSELQSQIEDLKSYKTSLITEAVTGKIDLR